ncbi:MAG: hypothetical protein KY464_00350 [Gemmatimonadetes bacterium]|nr:hypothetical protein [Gemmatimonadota bacterium]
MGTRAEELRRLAEPFAPDQLEWRVGRTGKGVRGAWVHVLAYQTSRAVMDRFDEVCGVENWANEFRAGPGGGVLCRIGVNIEGAGWVWKEDGAENTNIEAVKGGLSGAMKRAAVQWGVGRYLYGLEETFGLVHQFGLYSAGKGGERFRWNPPALPDWALPAAELRHRELLAFIKAYHKRTEGRVRIGDAWTKLVELVGTHADLLKRDYFLARTVAKALSIETGVPLDRAAIDPAALRAA